MGADTPAEPKLRGWLAVAAAEGVPQLVVAAGIAAGEPRVRWHVRHGASLARGGVVARYELPQPSPVPQSAGEVHLCVCTERASEQPTRSPEHKRECSE